MEALCQLAIYIDAKNYKYRGNDIWLLKATTSQQATLYDTFSYDRVTSVSLSLTAVSVRKIRATIAAETEMDQERNGNSTFLRLSVGATRFTLFLWNCQPGGEQLNLRYVTFDKSGLTR